jgi:hypothetical protein
MGALTKHEFNHSTLGAVRFYSYVEPGETIVEIQVEGQPNWNIMTYRDGEWIIAKYLNRDQCYSKRAGNETEPGQYTIDFSTVFINEKQDVSPEVLQEIVAEFKKTACYRHARKEIRKAVKEADEKIESTQRKIITLMHNVEQFRRFSNLNTSGL